MNLPSVHVRSIPHDMILMLITCGLYNIYIQDRQINALNAMYGEERYSFLRWAVLTLVTCGIYHIYYEYRMSSDLRAKMPQIPEYEPLMAVILSFFACSILVDAIQQTHINRYFNGDNRV